MSQVRGFAPIGMLGFWNIGHHMGWGNQVDVMAAHLLEAEHHVCQVFILKFLSSSLVGDWPVLAEDAAEVAVGKKDGA